MREGCKLNDVLRWQQMPRELKFENPGTQKILKDKIE
jgi:hypothetical protein